MPVQANASWTWPPTRLSSQDSTARCRAGSPLFRDIFRPPFAMFAQKAVEPAINRKWPGPTKAKRKKASQIEQVGFISGLAEMSPSSVKRLKFDRTKSVWQVHRDDRHE